MCLINSNIIEIENKEFKKGIMGYKEEEVDELDPLAI